MKIGKKKKKRDIWKKLLKLSRNICFVNIYRYSKFDSDRKIQVWGGGELKFCDKNYGSLLI